MSEHIDRKRAISEVRYEVGNVGAKVMSRVPYAVNLTPVVFCRNCKHRGSRLDKTVEFILRATKWQTMIFVAMEKKDEQNLVAVDMLRMLYFGALLLCRSPIDGHKTRCVYVRDEGERAVVLLPHAENVVRADRERLEWYRK